MKFLLLTWLRPKLKEHMQYCVEHQEEVSKLAQVKAQVSEVQQVMRANIDQVWHHYPSPDHRLVLYKNNRSWPTHLSLLALFIFQ